MAKEKNSNGTDTEKLKDLYEQREKAGYQPATDSTTPVKPPKGGSAENEPEKDKEKDK